jgi:hypothetical protein
MLLFGFFMVVPFLSVGSHCLMTMTAADLEYEVCGAILRAFCN